MVTCVVYASDGSVQPTATAPSIQSHSRCRHYDATPSSSSSRRSDRVASSLPLPSQLVWEQTGSEYIEYRETEERQRHTQQLRPADYYRQQFSTPPSTSPPLSWRAVLAGLLSHLPRPFSHSFSVAHCSPPSSSVPASSDISTTSLSTPFSYSLFDPHTVYCGSDSLSCSQSLSESTFEFFTLRLLSAFRHLARLLSAPLSEWRPGVCVPPFKLHSLCAPLCRSLAVLCGGVVLVALAVSGCLDGGSSGSVGSVTQSVQSQSVSAAGAAVSSSHAASVSRIGCSYSASPYLFRSSLNTTSSACVDGIPRLSELNAT